MPLSSDPEVLLDMFDDRFDTTLVVKSTPETLPLSEVLDVVEVELLAPSQRELTLFPSDSIVLRTAFSAALELDYAEDNTVVLVFYNRSFVSW